MFMNRNFLLILLSVIFGFGLNNASGEWGKTKDSAAFSRVPQAQNEKAIVECLDRLRGFISTQETTNLDNLKTKIERIYGMKQSKIHYRELFYKNQVGEKWRVEFYLLTEAFKVDAPKTNAASTDAPSGKTLSASTNSPGINVSATDTQKIDTSKTDTSKPEVTKAKDKYRLKFYKLKEGEGYAEALSPEKEEVLDLDKMLKFGHAEEIEADERWERFELPKDPTVNYKLKNFKAFELSVALKKPKTSLLCNMAGGHPFCQCSMSR